MTDFQTHFSSFSNEKLFSIILNPKDYQPQAIEAARAIVKERGLEDELNALLQKQAAAQDIQEQQEFEQVVEKAKYYKDLVEWRETGVSFSIRIFDIPRFEGQLGEQEIVFHREDKHVGAQLDTYPTQMYYFRKEDAEAVDLLVKKLELITAPYTDIKPFFKFEIVVTIAVFFILIICIIVFGNEFFSE
ncbi:MAG: hypothetical protein K0R51_292 [Cytophagaceae bacterium]|jgi:hypothetical protein|nr:hypothetical protein [Cytophagaceae bacterium]